MYEPIQSLTLMINRQFGSIRVYKRHSGILL